MAYNAGTAFLQVIPSFRDFERSMGRNVRSMGKEFGRALAEEFPEAFDRAMQGSVKDLADNLRKDFAKDLPNAADDAADQIAANLEEKISKAVEDAIANGAKRGVKSGEASAKRVAATQAQAQTAAAKAAEQAAKRAAAVLEREARQAANKAAAEAERAFGQTWAGRLQKGLRAAFQSLPDFGDVLNLSQEQAALAALRAELARLSDVRVGVDLDAGAAEAELVAIREHLRAINGNTADIEIKTDSASALAEMTGVLALMGRIDGADLDVDIDVDADRAASGLLGMAAATSVNLSRLQALVALGASIGLAIIPAAAAATSAIGFLGTSALAAASGIGVMILGFQGIGDAVSAMNEASLDAEKSQQSLASAAMGVASAQDAITSAESALANARADAADAARRAAQAVADAERDLADAREEAARAAEEAADRVADAQQDLGRAEDDARQARQELTEAYVEAQQAYEDLTSSIKANALSERQAMLDVAEAKQELDEIIANPRATEAEREQARITYEREVLQLEDIQRKRDRLADDLTEANQKGVEGSDQVTAAREKLATADERVADAAEKLGDLLEAQNQQRIKSARSIADAERQLSDARLAQDAQARRSAYALQQASQGLVAAQRQLQGAYLTSSTAGGEALQNLQDAMAQLSPTAQRFAKFIFGLKDEFLALKFAASDGMLSGAETAIRNVLPGFEGLRTFVADVSKGIGDLFVRFSEDLSNPTFQRFFDYIKKTAVPSMNQLYEIGSNITQAFINLFLAFTPMRDEMGTGLVDLTEKFRIWSEGLDNNQGFQNFLKYVQDNTPKVLGLLKEMARFVIDVVHAAAPLGSAVVDVFKQIFEWINKIPQDTLTTLIGAIAGVSLALTVLGAVTAAVALGTAGAVVAIVGAVVAGIGILYTNSATFRAVIGSLGDAVLWLWQEVITPAFSAIGTAFTWLIENMIRPGMEIWGTIFKTVGGVIRDVWVSFIKPVFDFIGLMIRGFLTPIIQFFYANVIKPVFSAIGIAASVLGAAFKVFGGVLQIVFKILSAVVLAWYTVTIKPVMSAVTDILSYLGTFVTKYVEPPFSKGMKKLGEAFATLRDAAKVPIKFVIETVLNNGLLKAYNTVAKAFKVKPDDVSVPIPKGWATGGVLPGFTPGRDVHRFYSPTAGAIALSGGEGIMRPELTRAVGKDWLDAGNAAARRGGTTAVRQWLGSGRQRPMRRRKGDGLGDFFDAAVEKAKNVIGAVGDILTDPIGGLQKLGDKLIGLVPGADSTLGKIVLGVPRSILGSMVDFARDFFGIDIGGEVVGTSTLGGSAGMMSILRTAFPDLRMISGFRPGATTLSGNRSYHASNRAVDVPPLIQVARWIRSHYGTGTRELITPWRELDLRNGKNHHYDNRVHNQHNFAGGNAHVHWAYDSGGVMPPGYGRWYNGTGKPEAVLTNEQWNNVSRLVSHVEASAAGAQYNFEFRDTTLTAERLRAIQDRDDTYRRVNRAG